MEDRNDINLAERVKLLESAVEQLSERVDKVLTSIGTKPSSPIPTSAPPIPPPPPKVLQKQPDAQKIEPAPPVMSSQKIVEPFSDGPAFTFPEHMKKSEYWLNKIGIGLLLFGAVFLFKYSVDQGWLTPTNRVFLGLALGAGLSVIGLRLYSKRKHFSQVLLGGSIATFYITGFAAFQLFHLVPYTAAFTFYVAVTLYSLFLSLKQNEFIFSLIAIIGGLGTPFILYTGAGSIAGLMLYLCILLGGASAIYFFKGWWSFFWTSCIGGWTVIAIAMFSGKSLTYVSMLDKVSLEVTLFLCLPFFWLVPLGREIAIIKYPNLLTTSLPKPIDKKPGEYQPNFPEINVILLSIVMPFLSLFMSTAIWQWQDNVWGWVSLALSITVTGVGWVLNSKTTLKNFAYTHLVVGLTLLTVALFFFFDGDVLLVAITLQAVAMHWMKIRIENKSLAPVAHSLFAIVGLTLLGRVTEPREGNVILNAQAIADLVVPAGAFALCRFFKNVTEKRVYIIGGFVALAGVLLRELEGNVEFLVMNIEAVTILFVAFRQKDFSIAFFSHSVNAAVGIWLIARLIESSAGTPVFNTTALVDILVIAAAAGATLILAIPKEKLFYLLVAHVALLLWFLRELSPLTNGQGLVSVAWGIYTVGVFVIGLRKNNPDITKTAMATLLLLVGKLFLVDLAHLETIWRILLFLSLGAVLLFLSYYFQSLWKTKKG